MIFNKKNQEAFVLPPKNGTNTICSFFIPLGWKETKDTHEKTNNLFSMFPNLNNYKIYGFLRDPLFRFESAVLWCKKMPGQSIKIQQILEKNKVNQSVESASYDVLIDLFLEIKNSMPVFFDPQSSWLDHPKVTILDFEKIESELRRISGNTEQPIARHNASTDFGRSVITDKVRAFVRDYYAADYALAKDRLNKEY